MKILTITGQERVTGARTRCPPESLLEDAIEEVCFQYEACDFVDDSGGSGRRVRNWSRRADHDQRSEERAESGGCNGKSGAPLPSEYTAIAKRAKWRKRGLFLHWKDVDGFYDELDGVTNPEI